MEIHLIRQGKTTTNEHPFCCDQLDLPLSNKGILELLAFKKQGIYPESINSFFTNGLLRSEQTLSLLYGSVHVKVISQLSEYCFDSFEILASIAQRDKSVLAVCHGAVISNIMEHLFPRRQRFYEWQPAPGRGYTIFHSCEGVLVYKKI
ncbi:MAG: histidine phosphatase family protein [Defluviitaleaceae bacterium]|nr:histidine phosphatase family protein [Defluviitaleaceae bacterium]